MTAHENMIPQNDGYDVGVDVIGFREKHIAFSQHNDIIVIDQDKIGTLISILQKFED